jgi:acyl-CoA synthetase (NDP forming)
MITYDELLRPETVAVVGASDDPTRIGGRPLDYLLNRGFQGTVYAVNPNRDTVQGTRSYPTLTDVPGTVAFVIVAVPAPHVIGVVEQAVAKSAKAVLILSSGFAEAGEQGVAWQVKLSEIAWQTGVRIIGPNCLGLINHADKFFPTFTGTVDYLESMDGHIGIASQSGAYGTHMEFVARRKNLGVRSCVTTGNECDLQTAEIIRLFAESDHIHTILAYAESIKDGDLLIEALDIARANRKPVIMMKVGRTDVGAAAASSHTASLAGEDAVIDAILRQYGAYRVRRTEEALDVASACRPRIFPTGSKLGIMTISGGGGVLMADEAVEQGLDVAAMPDDAQAAMKELVPFAGPRNPVDVTAQFINNFGLITDFTELMLDRGGYDALVGFWTTVANNPKRAEDLITSIRKVLDGREETLFVQALIAPEDVVNTFEKAGLPCFEDPSRAVAATAAVIAFGRAFSEEPPKPPPVPDPTPLPDGAIGEKAAKDILRDAGLPMVADIVAPTAAAAQDEAESFDAPLAMKIASPDILHKSDAGGVMLGVAKDNVSQAFEQIIANATAYDPDAQIDGVLMSPMIEGGTEVILGGKIDPVFGPIAVVGLGGVFTEVMGDVAFRRAPVSPAMAREMIDELQGVALLKGARGHPAADLDALCQAISALSVFTAAHADSIDSVELNPVRAMADGCVALDALIVKRR